jgi:curved DNA-binding protein
MRYDEVCKVLGMRVLSDEEAIKYPVEISLEEAYHGTKYIVRHGATHMEIDIPPGVRTGTRIRVPTTGDALPAVSDTYLVIVIRPHPKFRRVGDNLHTRLSVDLFTALLGGEVRVPTLAGEMTFTLPPETPSGKTFCITGKGMPHLRQPREHGDLYVHTRVHVPADLTDLERKLIADVASWHGWAVPPLGPLSWHPGGPELLP